MNLLKMQIPRIRIQRFYPSSSFDLFGDNGVCVFRALTLVGALFYRSFFMKDENTEEIVEYIIQMTAEKTNSKINFELEKARLITLVAETDFIDTLSKGQKNLYDDFCTKKEAYYKMLIQSRKKND